MKNRGFTLLELLGVIVILALLTTLVFPNVLNTIKKSSDQTDKFSMELISNAADIYIENHANSFKKRNGSKFIIDMKELIEDGNLPSNLKISDIEDIEEKCVQVMYKNNDYTYELKDKDSCEYFLALPEEYQQVEYIESTGTQYIDTGIIPNNETGFKIKMSLPEINKDIFRYGIRQDSSDSRFVLGSSNGSVYFGFGGVIGYFGNQRLWTIEENIPFEANLNYKNSRTADVNGQGTESIGTLTINFSYSIIMFGRNSVGTISTSSQKIYYNKITNRDKLIRNFIPCYRKSDGVIGMYDLVEDKFYTNLGTGTFEKGKDI